MKQTFRLLLLALISIPGILSAQNPSSVTIKGVILDTANANVPFATVMLLNPKDSTLLKFGTSDAKGEFAFKNVKNTAYLFKISYISYFPLLKYLPESQDPLNDLGQIKIKPITQELMEVVVRTAKAPLHIRGDTIEYDATTFKVPPGSTVEDLLRRLPGINVDADGNIKAQGKDVKRLYVDGKSFFGSDPKAATKNLGAETISKVQVFNEKSEQSKLTGVDDGKREKAMNLELKAEFKKGSFGKVTAAVGNVGRWTGRGNYNRFNDKQQLSFIAYGNNINQTGVNWEDYGEFKGQNTFNGNDNGDFGFSNGSQYFVAYGDGGSLLNGFDGRGFTKNKGAGANYNFDNKKTKFNASYFYNESKLNLDQFGFRQTFLKDSSFYNTDTTRQVNFLRSHNFSTRFETNIDSSNILIVKADTRLGENTSSNQQSQLFTGASKQLTRSLLINNGSSANTFRVASSAIFRHRFKKKGRSFAVSGGLNTSNTNGTDNLFNLNKFFRATTFTEQVRQLNNNANQTTQWKTSALFTEALSKKWFLEGFYNYSHTNNVVDRQVSNPELAEKRIDALSIYYDNQIVLNRLGSSLRYSYEGLNASIGLAAQQIQINGQYSTAKGETLLVPALKRSFNNWIPNANFSYEFPNNSWMGFNYVYDVSEPKFNDLQPVPNVNNPAFRILGNPNLGPERAHSMGFNYGFWNPSTFFSGGIGLENKFYDSQIVYNQQIEILDSIGVRTTTRPDNAKGGRSSGANFWGNIPIVKNKFTFNINGNFNLSKVPSFVNEIRNETSNNSYSFSGGFSITPSEKLILGINGSLGFTNIAYSIQNQQNQKIQNHSVNGSIKWQFAKLSFFESNLDYSVYRNARFGFNQSIPIWNASVRRLLGKSNRIETRFAAFDLLNRRVSIQQDGSQNYVSRNIASTLARYFMFSISYNVRGYETKFKKNNFF
jgi:hypothetical protein